MNYRIYIMNLQNILITIEMLTRIPVLIISSFIFIIIQLLSQMLHMFLKEVTGYSNIFLQFSPLISKPTNTNNKVKAHTIVFAPGVRI